MEHIIFQRLNQLFALELTAAVTGERFQWGGSVHNIAIR